MIPAFLLLAVSLVPGVTATDRDPEAALLLSRAEEAFAEGVKLRHDSVAARKSFRSSAALYDELWQRGHHQPALALNRAKSHRLAGNLPASIAALHEGLAVARYDRSLQVALEEARGAVAYPLDGELAVQARPLPIVTVGSRMSPTEAYLAVGLLWLLVCLAAVRFAMTRNWLLVGFAAVALICLAVLGGLWLDDWRNHDERPLVIVKNDVYLRKGNGENWEPRLQPRLPRGVEARELTRRGGWVQVELAGGAVGWLPEAAVILPAAR